RSSSARQSLQAASLGGADEGTVSANAWLVAMTVEIIGYAAIAPGADSASQPFDVLCKGICTGTEVPAARWDRARFWRPNPGVAGKTDSFAAGVVGDIESFGARLFGLSRREAM